MPAKPRETPIVLKPERLLAGLPSPGVLDDEGVHQLRRAGKKARAILRLAEDAGRAEARPIRCALMRATKVFAPLRDAAVVAQLAGELAEKRDGAERTALRVIAGTRPPKHPRAWWTRQWQPIAKVRGRLQRLDETPLSPGEIAAALEKTVNRACKRARRVKPGGKFKPAHEWRKIVKLLRAQLKAAPLHSKSLAKLSEELKRIAHCLGVAADHEAFMAAVADRSWPRELRKPARKLMAASRKKQAHAVRQARKCWRKVKPELKVLRKP